MTGNPSRKFTIMDAMVLVAAAATGLAFARSLPFRKPSSALRFADIHRALNTISYGSALVFPSVMAFTLAALVLRFKSPRPRFRRIFRQPGAVGCSAAAFSLFLTFLTLTPTSIFIGGNSPNFGMWMVDVWIQSPRITGSSVASVWFVQAVSGCWRPERDWVDRFGRLVASCWLIALALRAVMIWASLLDL